MIDSNLVFSQNLEDFFENGKSKDITIRELENKRNEISAMQKNILFLNDIELAKVQNHVKKVKLNQISLKTDLEEATNNYQKILDINKEKLAYMKEKYDERVNELREKIQEKNQSIRDSIREEEIKEMTLSSDIEKLRKKEQKYYSKSADSEIYKRCLMLKDENIKLAEEIQKTKEDLEKRNKPLKKK